MPDRPGADTSFLPLLRQRAKPMAYGRQASAPWLSYRSIPFTAAALTIAPIPAATTEINGGLSRLVIDGTLLTFARLRCIIYTPANAGATAQAMVSPDGVTFVGTGTCAIDVAGVSEVAWNATTDLSRITQSDKWVDPLWLRVRTINGDNVTNPVIHFFIDYR